MQPDLYNVIPAPSSLNIYVRSIIYSNQTTDIDFISTANSTGCTYLGWLVDGKAVTNHDYGSLGLLKNDWHLSGQILNNNIEMHFTGSFKHILFELKPLAAYQLFNIKGIDILNQCLTPSDLNSDLEQFCKAIVHDCSNIEINDLDSRIQKLSCALTKKAITPSHVPDYLIDCIKMLDDSKGALKINELVANTHVSARQFNRKFMECVGLSPKFYAKVLQMNHALHTMMSDDQAYLADVAQSSGFYDQAHLIHVIQDFFSKPPVEFINSDEQILFTFLARSRDSTLNSEK